MIIRLSPIEVNFVFAAVKSFGGNITISGNFILTAKYSIKREDLDLRRKDQFDKLSSDINKQTRMHSSRMRTVRSSSRLSWGGCLPQCMLGYQPTPQQTPLGADPPPRSRHPFESRPE